MSNLNRLENYLSKGYEATPAQINKMFNLSNHTAAINRLRSKGLCIYTRKTSLKNGRHTVKYQLGQPTKKMVQLLHVLGAFSEVQ